MREFYSVAAVGILLGGEVGALAQSPPVPTTVQLPTFHVFTVQTTVSVPDRGGMALGGISRGADGRVTLGPLGNRGTGTSRGASGVSATATIIDNHEIDQAILASGSVPAPSALNRKAAPLAEHVRATAASPPVGSVAAIRQHNAAIAEQKNRELAELEVKAQAAESSGHLSLARAYYGTLVRQASGELKQRAQARLSALTKTASAGGTKR
jgi:hypothetical protein